MMEKEMLIEFIEKEFKGWKGSYSNNISSIPFEVSFNTFQFIHVSKWLPNWKTLIMRIIALTKNFKSF